MFKIFLILQTREAKRKRKKKVLLPIFKADFRYKTPTQIEGISGSDMMKTKPWEKHFRIPSLPLQKIYIAGAVLCAVFSRE